MRKVIAMQPILYEGRMYKPGDSIPCSDTGLIELWVKNRAVRAYGDTPPPAEPPKQETGGDVDTPVTDQPGQQSDEDNTSTEPAANSEDIQTPQAPPAPHIGRSRSRAAATPEATPT